TFTTLCLFETKTEKTFNPFRTTQPPAATTTDHHLPPPFRTTHPHQPSPPSFSLSDTCAKGQNGDFTFPEGAITRARAKKLKESFRNLATLIHEEMYQLLAKEEKIKPIGLNVEKPKSCLEIHWA
ncbi:hypothetical protein PIB30_074216, partial [Stylosanthes scabra]|nr:hypothetical protein [Stylosanthes scabra]